MKRWILLPQFLARLWSHCPAWGMARSSSSWLTWRTKLWGSWLPKKSLCMVLTLIMFRKQGKGDCPRLQLKIYYRINKIRSAVCTFRNKNEVLYEVPKPKFDRAALVKNVNRIKRFLPKGSTITKMKQSYKWYYCLGSSWQNCQVLCLLHVLCLLFSNMVAPHYYALLSGQ